VIKVSPVAEEGQEISLSQRQMLRLEFKPDYQQKHSRRINNVQTCAVSK
jgi:hypothetical protein